jgi:predicted exporter
VGAAEAGQFVLVQRADADAVLRAQEALLPKLDRLVQQGVIGGYEAAAALLPSLERQRRNQAALPSPEVLAARLTAAAAGLPFRPDAFQPFLDAIAEAQAQRPWDLADIAGTALAQRLEPLLMRRGDAWLGPIQFRSVTDLALLRVALEGTGEVFVDVRTELEGILAAFRARAGWLVGGTGAVMPPCCWPAASGSTMPCSWRARGWTWRNARAPCAL